MDLRISSFLNGTENNKLANRGFLGKKIVLIHTLQPSLNSKEAIN
jgi:hypothetical protein